MTENTVLVEYLGGSWDGHIEEKPSEDAQKLFGTLVNPPRQSESPTDTVMPQQMQIYKFDDAFTDDIMLYCRSLMVFPFDEWQQVPDGMTGASTTYVATHRDDSEWLVQPATFNYVQGRIYKIETEATPSERSFAPAITGMSAVFYMLGADVTSEGGKFYTDEIRSMTVVRGRVMSIDSIVRNAEIVFGFQIL